MAPRKILAIKLRSLGDTVLMTAPLNELKRAFPEAELHVAVSAAWAPLLEGNPAIQRIWKFERHKDTASRAKAVARLALQLRREGFDLVVNFHASPSSALIAFATGAKTRSIHFHGHTDKNRYSTVEIPGKGTLKPVIERDMDAVRALGVHVPAGRLPSILIQESEAKEARSRLEKMGLKSPVLAMGLGASRPTKSWPLDRFALVAINWCKNPSASVLAITGPGEDEVAHEFMLQLDKAMTGAVSDPMERANIRSRIAVEQAPPIRGLAAALSLASVFVGNDSGPKHVAVAVGTPTVTIFGPEDPFEWHPYPKETHPYLFVETLACRRDAAPGMPPWCGLHECVQEQHACMQQIGADAVFKNCERIARREAS